MRAIRSQGKSLEETTMIAHPMTMQMVIDQCWHELRGEVERERLAMTAREQTPAATPSATLRLHVGNAVRLLRPIFARRQEVRLSDDVQQLGIP
jgi:hypothetical protein